MNLEKILAKLDLEERTFVTGLIDKDPLTGVYNRRKFDQDVELIVAMSDRSKTGSSLLMIDVDHFKQYNDTHGHQAGDRELINVAQSIMGGLRDYDRIHIYRYGGEEFVVLIPEILTGDAITVGERIRNRIKDNCNVTVSIGVSHYKEISENLHKLIKNADMALYEAKRRGRDQTVLFSKELEQTG